MYRASLVAQMVKNLPAMQETQVRSLSQEGLLEKGMAVHSSVLGVEFSSVLLGFPGALPQRRVVWMWFGALPGAIGLGRAQPQRRGTSP